MGLTLTVGGTSDAFIQPYANSVAAELKTQLNVNVPVPLQSQEAYFSEELPWSGWSQLQQSASDRLGPESVRHLLGIEAWSGVYLDTVIEPQVIQVQGSKTPLQCASLPVLVRELIEYGISSNLPVDETELQALSQKYLDDDDLVDEDFDIQTYAQLLLTAKIAANRHLPLWIVK